MEAVGALLKNVMGLALVHFQKYWLLNVLGISSIDLAMTKFEYLIFYDIFSNCSKRRKKKSDLVEVFYFDLQEICFDQLKKKKNHYKFSIFKLGHIQIGRWDAKDIIYGASLSFLLHQSVTKYQMRITSLFVYLFLGVTIRK